jgi:hypothetical protein
MCQRKYKGPRRIPSVGKKNVGITILAETSSQPEIIIQEEAACTYRPVRLRDRFLIEREGTLGCPEQRCLQNIRRQAFTYLELSEVSITENRKLSGISKVTGCKIIVDPYQEEIVLGPGLDLEVITGFGEIDPSFVCGSSFCYRLETSAELQIVFSVWDIKSGILGS